MDAFGGECPGDFAVEVVAAGLDVASEFEFAFGLVDVAQERSRAEAVVDGVFEERVGPRNALEAKECAEDETFDVFGGDEFHGEGVMNFEL
jgi:hypothetical protein